MPIQRKWRGVFLSSWSFKRRENIKSSSYRKILFTFYENYKSIENVNFGTFHEIEIDVPFFKKYPSNIVLININIILY